MSILTAVKLYISKMIDNTGKGMKVFLLGKDTLPLLSITYAQSELLKKEVYLFERIDNATRETMKHMRCIVYLRPTPENVEHLCAELRNPRYGQYHLFFSNILPKPDIMKLANADEHEVVKEIQEFYADYIPILDHVFTVNMKSITSGMTSWDRSSLKRSADSLISTLLSLRKFPVMRYSAKSELARALANSTMDIMKENGHLFEFRRGETPLLLVLDRRDDPVTPLLNQWTYQAMVHELLGIENNRVDLSEVPGIAKDMREVILSPEQDTFFKDSLNCDFGEIGIKIKELVDKFQEQQHSTAAIDSISDMKKFVDNYPQFKKFSGTVSKHVAIVGELSRRVQDHNLLEVSETEQTMTTQASHAEITQKMYSLMSNSKVREIDLLRLVLLYSICYEGQSGYNPRQFVDRLRNRGVSDAKCKLALSLMNYGGKSARGGQLFGEQTPISITKKYFKGLQGVENVYTQHKPYMIDVLQQLVQGRLREADFAWLGGAPMARTGEIIVFVVGGVTYEEIKSVHQWNLSNPANKVVLGSTCIHNCQSFLESIGSLS